MSNRFYVNEVQIFGNNEMFSHTLEELKKQGAKWTDNGTFDAIEIKDPQGLMRAVELDTFENLKKWATEDVIDKANKKFYKHRDFSEVHDKELFWSSFEDDLKCSVYTDDGEVEKCTWRNLLFFIDEKRVFTPLNLYFAIKDDVDFREGNLFLKDGHNIIACMY